MSVTATETPWALLDMGSLVMDLRATVGVFGHLIEANRRSTNIVDEGAWRKVERDLEGLTNRAEHLWQSAWDQNCEEIAKLKADHAAELATAKAEKAALGSHDDMERAKASWQLLAAAVHVAGERCAQAGFPVAALLAQTPPEPDPEPQPELPMEVVNDGQ